MKYIYKLNNLDCPRCANKIETKLNEHKDINNASINFNKLELTLETNNNNPKELISKLVKEIEPDITILDLKENIIFNGKAAWEEIPIYYHASNVFATASTTETQGLTVIEAMAASLPVVALDDDAFRSVVGDALTGYLFKNKKDFRA